MPIWADPARGETIRLLADDDMTLLATFVAPPGLRPTAADLRLVEGIDPARFAVIAARDLPGVRVVTRLDEAEALVAVGADVVATTVHMVRDRLQEEPPPLPWVAPTLPRGTALTGLDRPAAEIAAAQVRAYPPGHVDHVSTQEAHAAGAFEALLAGDLMGPVHQDASSLVVDEDGRIVAGIIVTVWEGIGTEWAGGPWICEVFRLPEAGPVRIGRGLLARAVAIAALEGGDAIGLTTNAANRAAAGLYPRLGFTPRFHRVALDLPGSWPAP